MRRNGRASRPARTAALLLAVGLVLPACGWGRHRQNEDLTIGYIPWDEDVAVTYLWKHLLEQQGRTVKLKLLDMGPVFAGVARGDLDLFYDVWLPTTHKIYWDRYGDKVDKLVDWYDEAAVAWTIPAYVEGVNSIADLRGKGDEFDDAVIGIEAGAGLTDVSKDKVIPEYGLRDEYTVRTSSTAAMLEELRRSIDAGRPIVVTLWHPHWAYSAFRLKDLEDPKGALGGTETLSVIGKRGFGDEFPEVTRWIKNFSMTDRQLASLEDEVRKAGNGNEAKGIETWLQNNPDFPASLGIPGS